MTGNQIKGKGFRGALRYNLEKVEKGIAEVLDHSFVVASEKSIMKEIQMVRVQRKKIKKYFQRPSFSGFQTSLLRKREGYFLGR